MKIINTHRASGSWKVYCIVTKHTKCQICSKCVAISLYPERDMSSFKMGKKITAGASQVTPRGGSTGCGVDGERRDEV